MSENMSSLNEDNRVFIKVPQKNGHTDEVWNMWQELRKIDGNATQMYLGNDQTIIGMKPHAVNKAKQIFGKLFKLSSNPIAKGKDGLIPNYINMAKGILAKSGSYEMKRDDENSYLLFKGTIVGSGWFYTWEEGGPKWSMKFSDGTKKEFWKIQDILAYGKSKNLTKPISKTAIREEVELDEGKLYQDVEYIATEHKDGHTYITRKGKKIAQADQIQGGWTWFKLPGPNPKAKFFSATIKEIVDLLKSNKNFGNIVSEEIKDFIISVASGDSVTSKEYFSNIMRDKAIDALKNKQFEVAQTMFN